MNGTNGYTQDRDYGFVIGLLTGTVVGAGLALWLAPRAALELRRRVSHSARSLRRRASQRYQQASTRAVEAVDGLTRKGQDVRDDMAEAVARGAHEVERLATSVTSDGIAGARKHSAADHPAPTPHSL